MNVTEGTYLKKLQISTQEKNACIKNFDLLVTKNEKIYSGYREDILNLSSIDECLELASQLQKKFSQMLVLGIGGSALGTSAILNIKDKWDKEVFVSDNLDSNFINNIEQKISWESCCVLVISKSGGTLETMAQFLRVLEILKDKKLDFKQHCVAVTDPSNGSLNKWSKKHKIPSLYLDSTIGGRFSVMSPVGLLPLAFAGFDIAKFKTSAKDFAEKSKHQAIDFGIKIASLYKNQNINTTVLMPYCNRLKVFTHWWTQIWGESIGKIDQNNNHVGLTPVCAIGATDQHSLLQLLMEGPNQFLTIFPIIKKDTNDFFFTEIPEEFNSLNFAKNISFDHLLQKQAEATSTALENLNRPTAFLNIADINEQTIGELMIFMMDLTVAVSSCMKINPFDQPGVEAGKIILSKMLNQK